MDPTSDANVIAGISLFVSVLTFFFYFKDRRREKFQLGHEQTTDAHLAGPKIHSHCLVAADDIAADETGSRRASGAFQRDAIEPRRRRFDDRLSVHPGRIPCSRLARRREGGITACSR